MSTHRSLAAGRPSRSLAHQVIYIKDNLLADHIELCKVERLATLGRSDRKLVISECRLVVKLEILALTAVAECHA